MKYFLLIFAFAFSFHVFSQDIVILKNGDEIEAKVLEIDDNVIKYKRASNPTGPTYKLEKSKIFMIRYESGDKDMFGNSDTEVVRKAPNSQPFTSPTEFIYDPAIGINGCQIKKSMGVKVYGNRGNEIYYSNNIVYYGFDFTYVKLTNARKIGDDIEIIQKYFTPMNEDLTRDILPLSTLKKWMNQPGIIQGQPVFPNYNYRDFHGFVTAQNYCINFNDLEKIVQSYVLNEQHGTGMVINLVNFNKEREYSLVFVTFFDIATREILFATEASGEAGGSGWGSHWVTGIENAVRNMFIDEVYKPRRTINSMIPGKLLFY